MDNVYKNFYRNFYLRSGGYIPSQSLNQPVFPGDFFQVKNGEIIVYGNIFLDNIVDPGEASIDRGIKLNPGNWIFSDGVSKPYSGRGKGHGFTEDFEYSKQVLAFAQRGSFMFRANNPEAIKIKNWSELQQQLIIKMTQVYYSFRDLYVVTESASASEWTLAVAAAGNAELEVVTETENFGLADVFGDSSSKMLQSKDIEYYHHENKRKPVFFRAKKLAVQEEKQEAFISELITRRMGLNDWAGKFFHYDFSDDHAYMPHMHSNTGISVLDMLQANELNPNTALIYFKWVDANMDDIEKLFMNYGT